MIASIARPSSGTRSRARVIGPRFELSRRRESGGGGGGGGVALRRTGMAASIHQLIARLHRQ